MRPNSASEARPEVRRDDADAARRSRPAAAVEDIEQFRQCFDQHAQRDAGAHDATRATIGNMDERDTRGQVPDVLPAEAMALLNTHRLVFELPVAATAMPAQSAGLTDLIEKHVRQLLVSDSARSGAGREVRVMLRLADSMLPGTDLMLTRGDAGWELRAEANSAAALDALHDCAPALVERFAAGGLGKLSVETVLRG